MAVAALKRFFASVLSFEEYLVVLHGLHGRGRIEALV